MSVDEIRKQIAAAEVELREWRRRLSDTLRREARARFMAKALKPSVIRVLEEGPATSRDVSDATGLQRGKCSVVLYRLWIDGVADRKKMQGDSRWFYLYTIKE